MIARVPVAIDRHVVDVGGIFAVAAPGIAHVVEEVRAEDVTAEAPSPVIPFAEHMHRACPNLVDAAHVPAEMVMAWSVRARESHHMVVAAMDSVQESDVVAGMIRKSEPKNAGVKLDRLRHVRREHQDMSEPARIGAFQRTPEGRAALPRAGRDGREDALLVRRGLRLDGDLDQIAVVVVEPNAVRIDVRRRIETGNAHFLQAFCEAVDIVLECTERDVLVLLSRTLTDEAPNMRGTLCGEREAIAPLENVKAEFRVEILRDRKIRRDELEMVDGMNAELSRPTRRMDMSLDLRHCFSSLPTADYAAIRRIAVQAPTSSTAPLGRGDAAGAEVANPSDRGRNPRRQTERIRRRRLRPRP